MNFTTRRKFRYGAKALILTAVVLAVSALIYGFLERRHLRWDWTHNRDFSLSDQTKKVLAGLEKDVQVIAFFGPGEDLDDVFIRRRVDDTLKEYAARSPHLHYEMVAPDTAIEKAVQYQVKSDGTIVFQSGQNRKEVYKSSLFDYSQTEEKTLPDFVGEGHFTNAILKVSQERQKVVCLLGGHGERRTNDSSPPGLSQLKDYLAKNNYETREISMVTDPKAPEGCHILLLAGPVKPLPPPEDTRVLQWIRNGGRLLLLAEPVAANPLPLTLRDLRVELQNDLVLDPKRHFLLGPHYPSPILSSHPITRDLQTLNPILSTARSLAHPTTGGPVEIVPLMTTSPEAWGETDFSGTEPRFNAGTDHKGPLDLAVAVSKPASDDSNHQPLAVIVGDADLASNGLIHAPGNLDLVLNLFGWLSGTEEQISIRPKTPEFRNIALTEGRARFIAIFSQIVYPFCVLMAGGIYWFKRRRASSSITIRSRSEFIQSRKRRPLR